MKYKHAVGPNDLEHISAAKPGQSNLSVGRFWLTHNLQKICVVSERCTSLVEALFEKLCDLEEARGGDQLDASQLAPCQPGDR